MENEIVVCNADTDSIMIAKSDGTAWTDEEQLEFIKYLNAEFPELIKFEHDGYYDSVAIFKAKNYALLMNPKYAKKKDFNPDGTVKMKTKGSSIRTATKEVALRELMNAMIDEMLKDNRIEVLQSIYKKYVQEALNVTDISRWSTKKTISDKVLAGANPKNEVRKQELDVWKAIKDEDDKQEGNKIYLYPVILGENIIPGGVSAKTGKPLKDKVEIITGLKLSKYWTNDHNVDHLVKRVFATVKIFKNVLDMDQFIDYSTKRNKNLLEELKQEVINLNISKLEIEDDEDSEDSEA